MPVTNNPSEMLNVGSEQSVPSLPAPEKELTDLAFSLFTPQETAAPAAHTFQPEIPCEDNRPVLPAAVPEKAAAALSGDIDSPDYPSPPPSRPVVSQADSKITLRATFLRLVVSGGAGTKNCDE